ncbi:MAG: B12-binding domain-containing radical SAM protein [Aestuariibacter sp.]
MKSKNLIKIYLADLTYDARVLSSNVHPLGIGLIAAHLLNTFGQKLQVELFKYPKDLIAALEREKPDLIGFSNYSWTLNLSYEMARLVKKHSPETVVIFGGPNYGLENEEIEQFWREYEAIDFHIVKEGEIATERLVGHLLRNNFDAESLKALRIPLPNCHYKTGNEIIQGETLPRLDIEEIPSPYLMGLMDKFFDQKLIPMIHTTRGCPFMCTFCAEGSRYYTKVKHKMDLRTELEYIAQRIKGSPELYITDANFGMFKQDIEKAKIIAEIQDKYDYPNFIHVSGGKNHQERVLEVADIVNGAMRGIAAALQSTDEEVLDLVKRKNISQESLQQIANNASELDTTTYTEIILGLPGDSKNAHFQTIRDVVEADMGIVRMYQALLLPQTEMNTPESRTLYGMDTRFRLMPRSFGRYTLFDETFVASELEELCVSTKSLSFDEYVTCRELNLTVEIIHNGNTFDELKMLCKQLGLQWFDLILRIFEHRNFHSSQVADMFNEFRAGTSARIYKDKHELREYVKQHYDELVNNTDGTNEMATGKAVSFFRIFPEINSMVFTEAKSWFTEKKLLTPLLSDYLTELELISLYRKQNLINNEIYQFEGKFDWLKQEEANYKLPVNEVKSHSKKLFKFSHNNEQRQNIENSIQTYGETLDGLSRIIMFRVHHKQIFRTLSVA